MVNPRKHKKNLKSCSIAYLKLLNLESYNTNVWGEVKINEARRDLFFDHHVTLWGHDKYVSFTDLARVPGRLSQRVKSSDRLSNDATGTVK